MDTLKSEKEEVTVTEVVIYATLSCIVVSFIFVLLYLTCSKRYKLNWFENNLLETAKENEENAQRFVVGICGLITLSYSRSDSDIKPFFRVLAMLFMTVILTRITGLRGNHL